MDRRFVKDVLGGPGAESNHRHKDFQDERRAFGNAAISGDQGLSMQ